VGYVREHMTPICCRVVEQSLEASVKRLWAGAANAKRLCARSALGRGCPGPSAPALGVGNDTPGTD